MIRVALIWLERGRTRAHARVGSDALIICISPAVQTKQRQVEVPAQEHPALVELGNL